MPSCTANFEDRAEPVYLKVPEGFEQFYPKKVVLMLLRTIYGLCEAAMTFWKEKGGQVAPHDEVVKAGSVQCGTRSIKAHEG